MINIKSTCIIVIIIFIAISTGFSQSKDSVSLHYWPVVGYVFKHQDKYLLPKQARELMKVNPEAYSEMLKARKNGFGHRLMNIGGVLLVAPFIINISGNDKTNIYPWLISGIAVGATGYPFARAHRNHFVRAVDIYNNGL